MGKKKRVYRNSLHCFKKILAKEGSGGLYKGCLSNVMRGMGASLVLVLYDDFKKLGTKYLGGHWFQMGNLV